MKTRFSSGRMARVLFWIMGIIVTIHIVTLVLMWGFGHDNVHGLVHQFDVDGEDNIPAYFSFALLFAGAVLLAVIARRQPAEMRPRRIYWAGLSLIFTYLSLDEGFEIHERVGNLTARWLGAHQLQLYSWLIPYAIAMVVFLALYARFLFQLPPADQKRIVLAGFVYVMGAVVFEALGAWFVDVYHTEHAWLYDIESAIEETLEMTGSILFIYALMKYIEAHISSRTPAKRVQTA